MVEVKGKNSKKPIVDCEICRKLPDRFCVTNENLSDHPSAKKLIRVFSCNDCGALPEFRLLKCPVCGSYYYFSSHATMTGGDWETADCFDRLNREETNLLAPLLDRAGSNNPSDDDLSRAFWLILTSLECLESGSYHSVRVILKSLSDAPDNRYLIEILPNIEKLGSRKPDFRNFFLDRIKTRGFASDKINLETPQIKNLIGKLKNS